MTKLKIVAFGYIFLLHLMLGIVLYYSDFIDKSLAAVQNEQRKLYDYDHFRKMLYFHEMVDKNVEPDSVLFLGDSHVQGLAVGEVANRSVNFGIGRDTSEGLLFRIGNYKSLTTARLIVISIGTNDVLRKVPSETTIENIKAIIRTIPSETKIIINSLFPLGNALITNTKSKDIIEHLNKQIGHIASSNANVIYLKVYSHLTKEDGLSNERYFIKDGIHLNRDGYAVWTEQLASVIKNHTD